MFTLFTLQPSTQAEPSVIELSIAKIKDTHIGTVNLDGGYVVLNFKVNMPLDELKKNPLGKKPIYRSSLFRDGNIVCHVYYQYSKLTQLYSYDKYVGGKHFGYSISKIPDEQKVVIATLNKIVNSK